MNNSERRSLTLTTEQWAALEQLAEQLNTRAEAGPTVGAPSWRALIRQVAEGDLIIQQKDRHESRSE